jgi:cytochrome c-type biogenesis protein CcsB
MTIASALLAAALIALLGAALIGLAGALSGRAGARVGATAVAHGGVLLAGAFLLAALAVRGVVAGRAPWSNLHETAVTFAFGVAAVYGGLERRLAIRPLAPGVALLGAGLVGLARAQPDEVRPLVPALQAPLLLTVHVGSAMLAYAIGAVAFAGAAAELLQLRAGDRIASLPPAAVSRAAAYRAVLLGFPVLTAAIVLGAVWANLAWRSYWSNDPKELAAAATWLVYGGYLHVAGRRDRWGRLAPWLLILGFGAVLFTYLGAGLVFVGEHSYAGA